MNKNEQITGLLNDTLAQPDFARCYIVSRPNVYLFPWQLYTGETASENSLNATSL